MKVLHTSDWHLGKKLYKKERLGEQEKFLNWLIEVIEKDSIDILLVSGDIFDSSIPPTSALSLFFTFLKDLEKIKCLKHCLIISGNHDSANLLTSPRPFLNRDFVQIIGHVPMPQSLEQSDIESWHEQSGLLLANEGIQISALPFFRARDFMDSPFFDKDFADENGLDQAILVALSKWQKGLLSKKANYHILMAHHLFGNYQSAGSEQGVSLSGIDSINTKIFNEWDYLALGHIHKPQCVSKEKPCAYYSGSPISMRFSEQTKKYVNIITTTDNKVTQKEIPIFRALFKIEATKEKWFDQLIKKLENWPRLENTLNAYLELSIHFEELEAHYIDNVREQIKDLPVELLNYFTILNHLNDEDHTIGHDVINDSTTHELFDLYLDQKNVTQDEKKKLTSTFNKLYQQKNIDDNGDIDED